MRKLAALTGAAMVVLGFAGAAMAGVGPTVIIQCQAIRDGGGYAVKNASNSTFPGDGLFLAHIESVHEDDDNCTEAVAQATQNLCADGMHVTGAPGGHVTYSILPNLCESQ